MLSLSFEKILPNTIYVLGNLIDRIYNVICTRYASCWTDLAANMVFSNLQNWQIFLVIVMTLQKCFLVACRPNLITIRTTTKYMESVLMTNAYRYMCTGTLTVLPIILFVCKERFGRFNCDSVTWLFVLKITIWTVAGFHLFINCAFVKFL